MQNGKMKELIEVLSNVESIDYSQLVKLLKIDIECLNTLCDQYNRISFYAQIVKSEDRVYIDNADENVGSVRERQELMRQLYVSNCYSILEFEIIFGRSTKTIYRDLKIIRDNLQKEFKVWNVDSTSFILNEINKFKPDIVTRIMGDKKLTHSQFLEGGISSITKILEIEVDNNQILHLYINRETLSEVDKVEAAQFTRDIIKNIEYYLHMNYTNDAKRKLLQAHIESKYFAYKNRVLLQTIDPLQIVHNYKEMYSRVSPIIEMLFNVYELYCNEEEIMYIALYFLNIKDFTKLTVNVKALKGSEKILIQNQLLENFENFDFVEDKGDLTITNIPDTNDSIFIKTMFDSTDIKAISKVLDKKSNLSPELELYFKLKPLLKKSTDYDTFLNTINPPLVESRHSLETLVGNDLLIDSETTSWLTAIKRVCNILKSNLSTDNTYYDEIMKYINNYKTEFLISDSVALIHAPITSHIFKTDMVVIYNHEGIDFPNEKKIKLVIGFCAKSEVDMLLPLQQLYSAVTENNFENKIEGIKNQADLKEVFKFSQKNK
ncbi:MAG: PTS sugar transporter subunit IIA [Bacilli bacterium]